MKCTFIKERAEEIKKSNENNKYILLSEEMLTNLPEPVRKYLRICGYMYQPVIYNADVTWRESFIKLKPDKGWAAMEKRQFNSVNPLSRIAYMNFLSMPIAGRDIYRNGKGEMKGKLFNLFPIINGKGKEVSQSSLITIFCEFLFIPGYILQDYVKWEYLDAKTVKATLCDKEFVVSGIFHFDNDGFFSRFETDDRYFKDVSGRYLKTKFSAIVDSYQTQTGIKIAKNVRIIWHLRDNDYEYFKGSIDNIVFNVAPGQ